MSNESRAAAQSDQAAATAPPHPAAIAESSPPAWLIWDLALMILLSAFLLFQVQPLISKFILPWFGGSPAVWTTCMLFFQSLLFCGYAYAHLTSRLLSCRRQAILHVALIVAACIVLPIVPNSSWKPTPGMEPTWRILGLLAVSVGLPYFVLSATGPLGQAWFSRAYAQRSPYRLYSLSNVGSLAALLTFPILFEPAFAAETQAWLWSLSFAIFGVLCASVGIWIWRNRGSDSAALDRSAPSSTTSPANASDHGPTIWRRVHWLALPAWASLMFLATTNHICQDVAVVPFLWVAPLALYLLSFIICFDHERWYRRGPFAATAALGVFLSAGAARGIAGWLSDELPKWISSLDKDTFDLQLGFVQELALYLTTLFLICMVCHGELVRLRPKPRLLTEYYLMIAAGGAIGGIFVSLIAPRVFRSFLEWNIGLTGSFVLAASLAFLALRTMRRDARENPAAPAARKPPSIVMTLVQSGAVGLLLAGVFFVIEWQIQDATPSPDTIYRRRNFYGVVRVEDVSDTLKVDGKPELPRHFRQFISGRIRHGRQWVDADRAKRNEPTTYYARESGVGRALMYVQKKKAALEDEDRRNGVAPKADAYAMKIGVVGLGAGTLASYIDRPASSITFYEINPEVEYIANTYFTFLKDCVGQHTIELGDARLSMENEQPQNFDVLVLDAFSGDAPPVHLLTAEAFQVYQRHLKPGGIIAVNIKNTYVDLAPVVQAAANLYGFKTTRLFTGNDPARLVYPVDYMLLTHDVAFLAANPPILKAGAPPESPPVLWTDHYNNLFHLLMHD